VRISRNAGRRAAAATLASVAILGAAAACSSAGSPAASSTSATTGSTASASTQAGGQGSVLDGLSADQIASRATANLKAVSSVHVKGSVKSSGQSIALDLTLGTQGCTGTMGIKGQGSFVLLKIGKTLWIKPNDAFWKHAAGDAGAALGDLVDGKYIKPSAKDSGLASIGALCDPAKFAKSFGGDMTGMVKGATTTIAGQPALQIKDAADSANAYVTVSAQPEFLRLASGGGEGQLDFTQYNAPLHLTPPPASQVLDGAKYGF
jgi:hypothetical protein